MKKGRRLFFSCSSTVAALALASSFALAQGRGNGHGNGHGNNKHGDDDDVPAYAFSDHDRDAMRDWYHDHRDALPPGLAKKDRLPPGLERQLAERGTLPPGLQKRLEPLPVDLDRRLPRLPEYWERVVLERDVILIDRRTNRILDIIENVIALATGQ